MHRTTVIPHYEVANPPRVLPNTFFACGVRQKLNFFAKNEELTDKEYPLDWEWNGRFCDTFRKFGKGDARRLADVGNRMRQISETKG